MKEVDRAKEAVLRPAVIQKKNGLRKGGKGKWSPDTWKQVEGVFGKLLDLIEECCTVPARVRPEASVIHDRLEVICKDFVRD